MKARVSNPAGVLPSLTDVAFVTPIVFLFACLGGVRGLLHDGDTGWHVRTGEWILAHARVPRNDLFSFTKPDAPWFAWEWLWDACAGWLHQQGGMTAVVLASILILSLTAARLYRLVRGACGNVVLAIAVTVLAVAASSVHWLARPHLVTLLFTVLFFGWLETARLNAAKRRRLLWLPPLAMVLWTNLHGGFFVGILLLLAYAGGAALEAALAARSEPARAALRGARPWLLPALACSAATLVNPYGYGLHIHLAGYLTGSYHYRHILEFQSISFQNPLARYFEPLLLLGAAAAFWCACRRRFAHVLLLAGWSHLALIAARNIPIYAMVAAPIVAQCLEEWIDRIRVAAAGGWLGRAAEWFTGWGNRLAVVDRIPRLHLASAASWLLLAAVCYAPGAPVTCRAEYDPTQYPAKALEKLGTTPGRVFTKDEWGDYLIYRLYPGTRVFVDGRSDFYGADFEEKYLDVLNVKCNWEEYLKQFGIRTVLLPPDSPLSGTLKVSGRWRVAYDDGVAIIFEAAHAAGTRPEGRAPRAARAVARAGQPRGRGIPPGSNADPGAGAGWSI